MLQNARQTSNVTQGPQGVTMIAHDPTWEALLRPHRRETVFQEGGVYTDLQLAVEAARLVYTPFEKGGQAAQHLRTTLASIGFAEVGFFSHDGRDAQAFAAHRALDNVALVAVRGTEPDKFTDLKTDLTFWKTAWQNGPLKVHKGFADATLRLLNETGLSRWLQQHADARLIVTGHSLGAAIAALIASMQRTDVLVLLGGPRVADGALLQNAQVREVHHLVHCADLIARVPPAMLGYAELAPMAYIDASGCLHGPGEITPGQIDRDRSAARRTYLARQAWRWGNVVVRDLADHAPINYVRAFF